MGKIVRESLAEIHDSRPFFDSEHGPIHTFKDHRRSLPEPFDDEYFRHMQWAHLASGGAGGGMRWPNRRIHILTPGMRVAQRGLAGFLPFLNWTRFDRTNVTEDLQVTDGAGKKVARKGLARFGCASTDQAVVYLLRRDTLLKKGQLAKRAEPLRLCLQVPSLRPGRYQVTAWDTASGQLVSQTTQDWQGTTAFTLPPFRADLALAIRPA